MSSTTPRRHSAFRPCIDLHDGKVKQIVGGTLSDAPESLKTNFVATKPPAYYAELYKQHGLEGGHVIMLGKGNTETAKEALAAWPGIGLAVQGRVPLRDGRLPQFAYMSRPRNTNVVARNMDLDKFGFHRPVRRRTVNVRHVQYPCHARNLTCKVACHPRRRASKR